MKIKGRESYLDLPAVQPTWPGHLAAQLAGPAQPVLPASSTFCQKEKQVRGERATECSHLLLAAEPLDTWMNTPVSSRSARPLSLFPCSLSRRSPPHRTRSHRRRAPPRPSCTPHPSVESRSTAETSPSSQSSYETPGGPA